MRRHAPANAPLASNSAGHYATAAHDGTQACHTGARFAHVSAKPRAEIRHVATKDCYRSVNMP